VRADELEARKWIVASAEQGFPEALFTMGVIADNEGDRYAFFKQAAGKGHTNAKYQLAIAHIRKSIPKADPQEAVKLLTEAARSGYANAQTMLGLMYLRGEVVGRDTAEGIRLLKASSEQNHPIALFNLGLAYATGRGVEKSNHEAAKLYERAAKKRLTPRRSSISG
jgi:TPR repeat protein